MISYFKNSTNSVFAFSIEHVKTGIWSTQETIAYVPVVMVWLIQLSTWYNKVRSTSLRHLSISQIQSITLWMNLGKYDTSLWKYQNIISKNCGRLKSGTGWSLVNPWPNTSRWLKNGDAQVGLCVFYMYRQGKVREYWLLLVFHRPIMLSGMLSLRCGLRTNLRDLLSINKKRKDVEIARNNKDISNVMIHQKNR